MLLNGVFGFLPKLASNGVIFVVVFGVILRVLLNLTNGMPIEKVCLRYIFSSWKVQPFR